MRLLILGVALCLAATVAPAQELQQTALLRESDTGAELLPDSPGAIRSLTIPSLAPDNEVAPVQQGVVAPQVARKYARTIGPGMTAETWGAKQKFAAALRKQVSVGGFASPVFVAGLQHLRDSRPHYGTDSGAYGARIGAAYARQSTQQLLNFGVMSSLLHDDPRYYVVGPTHSFKSRVIYAATRVLVTRKDDGSNTANIPLFVGVVASQAMTNGFYPDGDRKWSRTVTGSLGSLASKMATQQFKEFSVEIRQHLPFRKKN